MNIQLSEVMMSYPHNLSYILYMKFWKFSIFFFADTDKSICPVLKYVRINIISHLFWVEEGYIYCHIPENEIFVIFCKWQCVENCEGMTSSPHSSWIFIRTGQEMFSKNMGSLSIVITILISYPIFIIFAPFCLEFFYISS